MAGNSEAMIRYSPIMHHRWERETAHQNTLNNWVSAAVLVSFFFNSSFPASFLRTTFTLPP